MNSIKNSSKLLKNGFKQNFEIQKRGQVFEPNKTIVELVSRNQEVRLIQTVSNFGFRLNNGLFAVGPIVIFNEILLSWNIKYGVGDKVQNLHPDLIPYLSRNRVPFEIHRSMDAAKLYNMMILDRRNVVAALVPPSTIAAPLKENREEFEALLEARFKHNIYNEEQFTRIYFKYKDEIDIRLKQQYISKKDLQAQIEAKNQASREKHRKMKFTDLIAEETKAIKEEEMAYLEDIGRGKETLVSKFEDEKDVKKKPKDDKKLIKDK